MLVGMWMTSDPTTVPPQASISSAAMIMSRRKVRRLLVAEYDSGAKKLVGIVSKYDIARAFPRSLNPLSVEVFEDTVPSPVSSIMTTQLRMTTPDTSIEEAATTLRKYKIGAMPVLREHRLVGIITESDIFEAFIAMTGANSGGGRIVLERNAGNLVQTVADLSERYGIQIVSMLTFDDRAGKSKGFSIFRFAAAPPEAFVNDLWKLGCRVLRVGG